MRYTLQTLVLFVLAAPALAQQASSSIARPSVYADNAAALSAAMTWCSAEHQYIDRGTPGAACFAKARDLLAQQKLGNWSGEIDRSCTDAGTYNRCMTPHIGRLVYALNDAFAAAKL